METVAVLPLVALVAVLLWQGAVLGQAAWLAGSAARAAARAQAVGTDPERAARSVLPTRLRDDLSVRVGETGVRVRVGVPAVTGGSRLLTVGASAHLPSQAP